MTSHNGTAGQRTEYAVSEMVLAASEDKIHRGAFVASPTMPWVWGAQQPSAPYHLVWSRDLYEIVERPSLDDIYLSIIGSIDTETETA